MNKDSQNLPPTIAATLLMSISSSLLCGIGTIAYILLNWGNPIWTNTIRIGGLAVGLVLLALGAWLMRVFIKKQKP